jgi:hypothetical protein
VSWSCACCTTGWTTAATWALPTNRAKKPEPGRGSRRAPHSPCAAHSSETCTPSAAHRARSPPASASSSGCALINHAEFHWDGDSCDRRVRPRWRELRPGTVRERGSARIRSDGCVARPGMEAASSAAWPDLRCATSLGRPRGTCSTKLCAITSRRSARRRRA